MSADDRPGRREVAYRVFAAEFDDATYSYAESDEERAPSYVVTPTGARANRVFVSGVLTAVEPAGESNLRARVVDPTGAFVIYAGQYEPEAMSTLERVESPTYLAITGKARTFEARDGDRVFSTVRPETVAEIDAETRNRWVVDTAEHTLHRIETFIDALDRPERGEDLRKALLADDIDPGLAAGIPRALAAYGTTPAYLAAVQDLAFDAARVVAGELDEVGGFDVAPDVTDADRRPRRLDMDRVSGRGLPADSAESEPAPIEPTTDGSTDVPTTEPDSTALADATSTEESAGTDTAGSDDSGTAGEPTAAETDAPPEGVETDDLYEIDEAERESVEEEFDMEFASGEDIPDAGEADNAPDRAEEVDDETADAEFPSEAAEGESEPTVGAEADLEDAVVDRMSALADAGNGTASRTELVETVAAEHDVAEADVEDAIQEALMSGRCYESGDGELTPI